MFKDIIIKLKGILGPYYNTVMFIVKAFIIVLIVVACFDLISIASTVMVLLGVCGLGVVGTYLVVSITNKAKNILKKIEEGEKNEGGSSK